jgi:hypothetical protein
MKHIFLLGLIFFFGSLKSQTTNSNEKNAIGLIDNAVVLPADTTNFMSLRKNEMPIDESKNKSEKEYFINNTKIKVESSKKTEKK